MSGGESQGTHQAVGEHLAHFATPCRMRIGAAGRHVDPDAKQRTSGISCLADMCRTMGSGEVWKLVPRLGLVVVLAASTATSQTERLPLAAIRRRAAELNNGAFSLVFSFWTTVSKDEKTAGVCRGSLGREALRRVTTSTINMCPDRRKHQPFVAGEDIEDAPMHRKKMRRQKPSPPRHF
jgi:hypothetical protein